MLDRKKSTLLAILLVLHILLQVQVETCHAVGSYFPYDYSLVGSTSYVSGGISDLQLHDSVYMTFRSYASQVNSQILYAHQETVTIASSSYYLSKLDFADASGMTLSASMSSTGRRLWGQFVYNLGLVGPIPTSTWTVYYRAWHSSVSPENLTYSPSQIPQAFWNNAAYVYSSDNSYANSSMPMQNQEYSGYGINLPAAAQITKVEVGYEAHTEVNERIRISVSWDGGTLWSPPYTSPILGIADPNFVSWTDFTSATDWNSTTLADGSFLTRVAVEAVGPPSNVFLDWLPVRVTYVSSPPLAHSDVDLLIRKSDGSIRQTLATNVAQSAPLSTVPQTSSASYSWTEYAVVDSTDYLEIDYFVDVVAANAQASACLQVDDATLVIADQTRVMGVILPSEQTVEVEFVGSSDINPWSEMVLSICAAWTVPSVAVSIQLYNYTAAAYATGGTGLITYVSSPVQNTEETKNRTITANPTDFKDTDGAWKVRIKGTRNTATQFDLKADLTALATKSLVSDIALLSIALNRAVVTRGELARINVTVSNQGESAETFNVTIFCNDTTVTRRTIFQLAPTTSSTIETEWETATFLHGNYIIRASADTLEGEIDTSDNSVMGGTLRICENPIAAFSFSPEYPVPNQAILFNATNSHDADGHIASYMWIFGDGNTTAVNAATIEHTYSETKTYNVTLVVSDNDGFTGIRTQLLQVVVHDAVLSRDWSWLLTAIPLTLVPLGLLALRRRKSSKRARGFEFFNQITDGGIPDSFSVLLIGGAGSGKSVWCQELTYAFLKGGKSCLYVTYNNPPNELRRTMEKSHPGVLSYEGKGRLIFVDCFSSAAKTESTEKYFLSRPFSLSDLGIILTKATSEMGKGIRILFDSTEPLLAHVSSSNVIDFLLDRTMRAKGFGSTFVLSVGKETIDAKLANRLEGNVDCVIELDICRNEKKTVRRMRVTKMSGRNPSDEWVQFRIDREKGITFL